MQTCLRNNVTLMLVCDDNGAACIQNHYTLLLPSGHSYELQHEPASMQIFFQVLDNCMKIKADKSNKK